MERRRPAGNVLDFTVGLATTVCRWICLNIFCWFFLFSAGFCVVEGGRHSLVLLLAFLLGWTIAGLSA